MKDCRPGSFLMLVLCSVALLAPSGGVAAGERVLYSFQDNEYDGGGPLGSLIRDKSGNLYGTTHQGGFYDEGTVYKLAPDGTETVLHIFKGGADGASPVAGLVMDRKGNLYGTTLWGGGYGNVFRVTPDGKIKALYLFCSENNCTDGKEPYAGVIRDSSENLYGTTAFGGAYGYGTVYKVAPDGTESVLYSFGGGSDGSSPQMPVIMDRSRNFFGTTSEGGTTGNGTVFELASNGSEKVLYSFCSQNGCTDGALPASGLIEDANGNLYGTTAGGGTSGHGVVFKLAPDGTETILHSFAYPTDGYDPAAGVVMDLNGNLYGTTEEGGKRGYGIAFKLAPDGTETVLHSFSDGTDGGFPDGLILDKKGNLYGTTLEGGAIGAGSVFRLKN